MLYFPENSFKIDTVFDHFSVCCFGKYLLYLNNTTSLFPRSVDNTAFSTGVFSQKTAPNEVGLPALGKPSLLEGISLDNKRRTKSQLLNDVTCVADRSGTSIDGPSGVVAETK